MIRERDPKCCGCCFCSAIGGVFVASGLRGGGLYIGFPCSYIFGWPELGFWDFDISARGVCVFG